MTKELEKAYADLDKAENKITALIKQNNTNYKVQQILIAAGFLTRDKINEAEAIMYDLEN